MRHRDQVPITYAHESKYNQTLGMSIFSRHTRIGDPPAIDSSGTIVRTTKYENSSTGSTAADNATMCILREERSGPSLRTPGPPLTGLTPYQQQ